MDELKLLCDYKEAEGLETCDEMLDIIDTLDSDDYDFVPELSNVVDKIKKLVQER